MKYIRKSTEELIVEVHSRFTNEQVEEMKKEVLKRLGNLSNEAVIEIIAQETGCEMDKKVLEEKEMENMTYITGEIQDKRDAIENKPCSYKMNGLWFGTFDPEQYKTVKGDKVKIGYVVKGAYNNIKTIELVTPSEELIKDEPKAKKYDSVLGARQTAMNAAVAFAVGTKEPMSESKVIEVAEKFHEWLTR